jgi:TonB family protein
MSSAFHPNPFDLLGQTEMYVYPVHLSGTIQPKLEIAWNSFHSNFFTGIPVFFQRAKLDKDATPSGVFPDVTIERRIPFRAILAAALLHVAFFMLPWSDLAVTPPPNHSFDNTQLVWSGPINDLPLLQIPKNKPKTSPNSAAAQPAPGESSEAFHPRQRIYTDPVRPTHPRQTLINPAAPQEAPKLLLQMPNIVQFAASQVPARPRVEISDNTLAKLRPKAVKQVATTDAPTPDISNLEQQTAALSITTFTSGPARPKLQINPSSAPRVADRSQSGDNSAAPEVPAGASNSSSAPSTLITISAAPGPPAPAAPVPEGNLAARVAISPEGKPGAPGTAPSYTAGTGSAGPDAGTSGNGAGSTVGVSISGGNPKPNANSSGLGVPGKFVIPRAESALKRPDLNSSIEDPPERTGPPNFGILPPGAKPEQIFAMKHVYSMNVNMPNLNSATGSWIIHFSELRLPDIAHRSTDVTSPVPVHKVDPKYPQEAALEHIEGEVILYGVIRRDGTVDSIQKFSGIDEQLDANAIEAFALWKFQPATRDGQPVDLEAIVHIPFKAPPRR